MQQKLRVQEFLLLLLKNKTVKNFISFLLFIALAIITSCATTKREYNCKPEIVPQEIIDTIQKGYSIEIPDNWYSYKGIHCALTHSPKEFKKKKNIFEYIRVSSFGGFDKYDNGNKIISLNELVNKNIEGINKTFNKPKIEIRDLQHEKYGIYKMIKFHSLWFENYYTHTTVIYYYKNKAYSIRFVANNKYFKSYLNDFSMIIESFTIKE